MRVPLGRDGQASRARRQALGPQGMQQRMTTLPAITLELSQLECVRFISAQPRWLLHIRPLGS